MGSTRFAWTFVVVVAIVGVDRCAAQPDKERFLATYDQYARRLEGFYRNLDLTEESTGTNLDALFGGPMTFRWRANGTKYRDDLMSLPGVIVSSKVSRGDVNCRVFSASAGTTPKLSPVSHQQTYSITEIHGGEVERLLSLARSGTPRLAFAPYCTYDRTILDAVKSDRLEVTSFDDAAPGLATLKYKNLRSNGEAWEGELVFDKDRCWALISDRKPMRLTKVEYGDSVSGVPIVKRLTYWYGGDLQTPACVSIVKDMKIGPAPESAFSLADFGLPDLPESRKPGFPIYAALGVGGLVIAILLGLFIRRRAKTRIVSESV